MKITEVRLTEVKGDDKLKAFVSITLDDDFVVRDLKVIKGKKGEFVAMPSRKLTEHCPKCGKKNDVLSSFCSSCGKKLPERSDDRNKRVYADIAHPINTECREMIQTKVLDEYRRTMKKTDSDEEEQTEHEPISEPESESEEGDSDSIEIPEDEDEYDGSEDISSDGDEETDKPDSSGDYDNDDDDDDDFSKGIW